MNIYDTKSAAGKKCILLIEEIVFDVTVITTLYGMYVCQLSEANNVIRTTSNFEQYFHANAVENYKKRGEIINAMF